MVCFQTKKSNLGKFWRVLQWKILVYFIIIWSFLRPLEIFYGHLVYFVVNWYISPRFGILHQEKSGNPDGRTKQSLHGELIQEKLRQARCVWILEKSWHVLTQKLPFDKDW
jgi:hypothetical protein